LHEMPESTNERGFEQEIVWVDAVRYKRAGSLHTYITISACHRRIEIAAHDPAKHTVTYP
jgi:hypothetical protein